MYDVVSIVKMFGASVESFDHTGGNESPISLTATLVEDRLSGDLFQPPAVWSPATFECGGLKFRGILTNVTRQTDMGSNQVYNVTLNDPSVVLGGVAVILDGFRETTADVPNLLNVYGYWENKLGFGGAMVSEQGMLWNGEWAALGLTADDKIVTEYTKPVGVKPAIEAMTREGTPFGGPVNFRGFQYAIDFSGLPATPEIFRVQGPVTTIMELVAEICGTAGADYQVYLTDDDVISFRSLSRSRPQVPGTISHWAGTREDVTEHGTGVELVNEIMNVELVGDFQQTLHTIVDNGSGYIWPFWGVDENDQAVWGDGDPSDDHVFTVPCPEIADVVGSASYDCSIAELRAAAVDEDSWTAFLLCQQPDKAELLNVVSFIDKDTDFQGVFGDLVLARDLVAVDEETLKKFGLMNENDYWTKRVSRIYAFVKNLADSYYGRKFLVQIPEWVYWKLVPDSFEMISSHDVSDGGWAPEGGFPLGLPYEEIDLVMTDDGRFGCFVAFNLNGGMNVREWNPDSESPLSDNMKMNISDLDPDSYTIVNGTLYVKATADLKIYTAAGRTAVYAVIELPQAVYDVMPDPLGGVEDLAKMLNVDVQQIANAAAWRSTSFPVRIHPKAYMPNGVALPLRSNRDRYGPWKSIGGQGQTQFEVDESLTPWACGDFETMNKAAQAYIAGVPTKLFEKEMGQITRIGLPETNIGEALIAGGPATSTISVRSGPGGVTTTYEMRTYTPVMGAFSRFYAAKLKTLGKNAQQARRKFRNLYKRRQKLAVAQTRAAHGFMVNASRAIQQRSPHECWLGYMVKGGPVGPEGEDDDSLQKIRTAVASMNPTEFIANIRADRSDFNKVGGMGGEGLLRPFSTNFDPDEYPEYPEDPEAEANQRPPKSHLPHFQDPSDELLSIDRKLLTTKDMNPFDEGYDGDFLISGDYYKGGIHGRKGEGIDFKNARPLALRGPLVVEGWGIDVCGKPVPNEEEEYDDKKVQDRSDEFLEDHMQKPDRWKVGTVGLMWNPWTSSWMAPGIALEGKTKDGIGSGVMGTIKLEIGVGEYPGDELEVLNTFSGSIPAQTKVVLNYNPLKGLWIIISADCPT